MDNQITVNDIVQFKNILEICSKRGAFQASEMEVVGGLYNRVKSFTDEVEAKAREQESNNEESKPLETVPEDPAENEATEKNVEMTVEPTKTD
jgi:hypothetical protein